MKKLFFPALAALFIVGMTSCKKDVNCSCTYPEASLNTVSTCEDCNKEQRDSFEDFCNTANTAATLFGGSCSID